MRKMILLFLLSLSLIMGCSGSGSINKSDVEKLVKGYYSSHPYMLEYPEKSMKKLFLEKANADVIEFKIIDIGKKNKDGKTAIKVYVKAKYTTKIALQPQETIIVEKQAVFYLGKDDFGKTTLMDEYDLYGKKML